MKTLTICGSLNFKETMKRIALELEVFDGYNILQCIYNEISLPLTKEQLENLSKAHFRKIEISDGIFVVNENGYIGASTLQEINFAKSLNKEIMYLVNPNI